MSGEGAWPAGVGRVVLDAVDSTNAEALRRLPALDTPCWIMARRQVTGRGRRNRPWRDPPGNFAASLVFRPGAPAAAAALNSFAAALALHECLVALTGRGPVFALKWPNDVLADGRKVAGILLESAGGASADHLVIGVGVNLVAVPDGLEEGATPATSVLAATGVRPEREALLDALAAAFARWHATLRTHGFAPLRDAWLARAVKLGEPVIARTVTETLRGTFETVDMDGALVLRAAGGRRAVAAAEVFFEGAEDAARD